MSKSITIPSAEQRSQFNQLAQGYINTQLVFLAARLRLNHIMADNQSYDIETLADKTETHAPTLQRFLTAMASVGLIEISEDGQYSQGHILHMVEGIMVPALDETSYQAWDKAIHSLKTGEAAWSQVHGSDFYQYLNDNPGQSDRFDRWNANSAAWLSPMIEEYNFGQFEHLLDIGGGRGGFLTNVLTAYPNLKGTVLDRQEVILHTEKALLESPVKSRITTQVGSFFDQIPTDADALSLCRVLLNWNDEQVTQILENCKQAMQTQGKLLILDFYIPEPSDPVYNFMVMNDVNLLITTGGASRTIDKWQQLVEDSGLTVSQFITLPNTPLFLLEATTG